MTAVDELVASARALLAEAEEWDQRTTGNGGRTPRLLIERAGVLGNLAVATALAAQLEQSERTAAAVTQAREALTSVAGRVGVLEAALPRLQDTAAAAGPQLAGVRERQTLLESGLAQVRDQITTLATQLPAFPTSAPEV